MNKTIIDIFPPARVSLIGATNLADAGGPVLSQLPETGNEYFYVDLSQTRPDFDEGLDMLDLDPDGINALTLDELDTCTVEEIAKRTPTDTKLLVIADAGALIDDEIHSPAEAFKLMRGLQTLAKDRNLTTVAIMPASNSYYGRERIEGDGLLPRLASTVVVLDPGPTPDELKATIMPLNRKQETVEVSIRQPIVSRGQMAVSSSVGRQPVSVLVAHHSLEEVRARAVSDALEAQPLQ